MRSAVALAAFAAGALAVPYGHRHHNRDVHTDYDIVIKTDVVYVTAGQPAPTSAAAPAPIAADTTSVAVPKSTHVAISEHQKWGGSGNQQQQKPSAPAPSVVIITTNIGPQAPTSTYVPAPAPTPSVQAAPEVQSPAAPAPAPQTSAAAPANNAPSAPASDSYQDIVVFHHNVHRANHSAPDIQWSDNLATSAAMVAATCDFAHNMNMLGGGYGQNICAGYEPNNVSAVITESFYNGEVNFFNGLYGMAQPPTGKGSLFGQWGHFSQLVWKGTTHVGCATHDCGTGGLANVKGDVEPYFTVCNYASEGNMANEYADNIGESLGHPTVHWNAGL